MSLSSILFRRLTVVAGLVGILGASLSGCGGGSSSKTGTGVTSLNLAAPGTTPFANSRQASAAPCQPNAHKSGRCRWTILVYMNAANNLQPDSLFNVAQMASVGSDGTNINIVLQWKQTPNTLNYFGSVNTWGTNNTNPVSFTGTHRYYIKAHNQTDVNNIVNGNTSSLEDAGERLADPSTNTINDNGVMTSDMGSYSTLQNFIQWGATAYPSDYLAVVVWDHGSGALTVDNSKSARKPLAKAMGKVVSKKQPLLTSRAVSQDAQTGNQITTPQLALGLANPPQPIDALIIDCSLQSTVEVAYEVRNSARLMIGSEESPPGTGYPYDTWLAGLQAGGGVNTCDMGNELIQEDINEYPTSNQNASNNITQAMTDLSEMSNVATALNNFGGSLLKYANADQTLIFNARQAAQYYEFAEFKDLYGFADKVRISSGVPSDLSASAAALETSLYGSNGAILASQHGPTSDIGSSGLTVFLPGPQTQSSVDGTTGYDPQYGQLAIAAAAPNWPAFLQAQVK